MKRLDKSGLDSLANYIEGIGNNRIPERVNMGEFMVSDSVNDCLKKKVWMLDNQDE